MNTDTYQFVLGVSGFLIVLLLGILGFFLRQQVLATKSLNEAVVMLQTSVQLLQQAHSSYAETHKEKHEIIDKRLDSHSDKISDHERRISKLEP